MPITLAGFFDRLPATHAAQGPLRPVGAQLPRQARRRAARLGPRGLVDTVAAWYDQYLKGLDAGVESGRRAGPGLRRPVVGRARVPDDRRAGRASSRSGPAARSGATAARTRHVDVRRGDRRARRRSRPSRSSAPLHLTGQPVLDLWLTSDTARRRTSASSSRSSARTANVIEHEGSSGHPLTDGGARSLRHLDPMPWLLRAGERQARADRHADPGAGADAPTDLVVPMGGRLRVTVAGSARSRARRSLAATARRSRSCTTARTRARCASACRAATPSCSTSARPTRPARSRRRRPSAATRDGGGLASRPACGGTQQPRRRPNRRSARPRRCRRRRPRQSSTTPGDDRADAPGARRCASRSTGPRSRRAARTAAARCARGRPAGRTAVRRRGPRARQARQDGAPRRDPHDAREPLAHPDPARQAQDRRAPDRADRPRHRDRSPRPGPARAQGHALNGDGAMSVGAEPGVEVDVVDLPARRALGGEAEGDRRVLAREERQEVRDDRDRQRTATTSGSAPGHAERERDDRARRGLEQDVDPRRDVSDAEQRRRAAGEEAHGRVLQAGADRRAGRRAAPAGSDSDLLSSAPSRRTARCRRRRGAPESSSRRRRTRSRHPARACSAAGRATEEGVVGVRRRSLGRLDEQARVGGGGARWRESTGRSGEQAPFPASATGQVVGSLP